MAASFYALTVEQPGIYSVPGLPFPVAAISVGGGAILGVTASAPLASSGGVTPNISLTGIVPVANGGTGAATLPAHAVLLGEGAAAIGAAAPGAAGQVLTSNGIGVDPSFQAPAVAASTPPPITFDVPHVTTSSATSIPATASILRVTVFITTQFSGGATLEIGIGGTPALLFGTGVVDPTQPAVTVYNVDPQGSSWLNWPGGALLATVGGAPAAGAATVQVTYATPSP